MTQETATRSGRGLEGADLYRMVGLLFLLGLVLLHFDPIMRVLLLAFVATIVAVAINKLVRLLPLERGLATAVSALVLLGGAGVGFSAPSSWWPSPTTSF